MEQKKTNKRYHPSIPDILHERPKKFIKHAMSRLENAVTSSNTYNIDEERGTCKCPDFQYHGMVCKHILKLCQDSNQLLAGIDNNPHNTLDELKITETYSKCKQFNNTKFK
jgi:hypothetical protein